MADQRESIAGYRSQYVAAELFQAVADQDFTAAEAMYAHEAEHGLTRELVSALAVLGVSLAGAVADSRPDLTTDSVLAGLRMRAEHAMRASADIDQMTNTKNQEDDK